MIMIMMMMMMWLWMSMVVMMILTCMRQPVSGHYKSTLPLMAHGSLQWPSLGDFYEAEIQDMRWKVNNDCKTCCVGTVPHSTAGKY